jgi:shikimate dehydrogenase
MPSGKKQEIRYMYKKPEILDKALEEYRDTEAEAYLGIFGHPIKHTLSPVIHDTLSEALGINERYVAFDVEGDLGSMVNEAYEQGIVGLNITVPFKQEVMKSLVCVDEAAASIGAVNTLVRDENGYKGYNTDMPGLGRALDSEGISLEKKDVIMLGAGGAARAVAYMCLEKKAKTVYIVNRTFEKAADITEDMNSCAAKKKQETQFIPVAADRYGDIPYGSYIFIQCTSIGLKEGDGLPLEADESFYKMAEAGIDLIYNPAETPFLKLMKKLGKKGVNGLKMLLYQGIMAYELWNNISVSEKLANMVYARLCERLYGKKDNIVLIGYMGSGKTTVGKYLSEKLGYDFVDTDEYIEMNQGAKVSEIFEKYGEEYFRDLETEAVKKLAEESSRKVIATGGGLPVREENEKWLKALGKVYYLKATVDIIYDRVCNDGSRPLLKSGNLYDKITGMLDVREARYMACADVVIELEKNLSVEDVAEQIMF